MLTHQCADVKTHCFLGELEHRLHSSRLEYLGIFFARKGFCKEFDEKHKADIEIDNRGAPLAVPPEIFVRALSGFQKLLRNALKHSEMQHLEVNVQGSPTEIRLALRDSGAGIDLDMAMSNQGPEHISVLERITLVKGTLSIIPRLQSGTEGSVRAPLAAGTQTNQAKKAAARSLEAEPLE